MRELGPVDFEALEPGIDAIAMPVAEPLGIADQRLAQVTQHALLDGVPAYAGMTTDTSGLMTYCA